MTTPSPRTPDTRVARPGQAGGRSRAAGRPWAMVAISLVLSGCAVGPTYQKPSPPAVSRYTHQPLPAQLPAGDAGSPTTTIEKQNIRYGGPVEQRWWDNFHSPALSALVDKALAHNPDIAAAQATLEQAEYQLRASQGGLFPQASAGVSSGRIRDSGASSNGMTGPQLFDLHTGRVSVSYLPDVFGLTRQQIKGADAQADVAREQLAAAQLTITGRVVSTVLDIARLEETIRTLTDNWNASQNILESTRARYRLGAISQFEMLAQEKQSLDIQSQLTQRQKDLDQVHHRLDIYLGEFPGNAGKEKIPSFSELALPQELPLSLPSSLVNARPDIRAAEAQLRAANAQVGEAAARLYPRIQITADFGRQSNTAATFFNPASRIWDLAGGLIMPLFQGGTLRAEKQASEAAYRAELARYRSTVLKAFLEVADVLQALRHDADDSQSREQTMLAAKQSLALSSAQYRAGEIDRPALLAGEMQYRTARLAFVAAAIQRYADTTALYLALGGGHPASARPSQP
ncbi:MAG: efflux transporter outer membrane subunit [Castellaniella sp.]|uniref:efflux transporter outer membrane subunit n=1 Tax=Castellaniella sp. TaxID=1955812 RepID=UPI0012100228|nr:efflux transporter outer membrane subunit [Castellaniella sp.]TAN26033.1 MAG: efflux transporter outer membrane subunit [Castellaniella sp.]